MAKLRELEWFEALSADAQGGSRRSINAGLNRFLVWLNNPNEPLASSETGLGAVPAAAAHAVSLGQTVDSSALRLRQSDRSPSPWRPRATRNGYSANRPLRQRNCLRRGTRLRPRRRAARCPYRSAGSDLIDALVTGRSAAAIELLASRVGFALPNLCVPPPACPSRIRSLPSPKSNVPPENLIATY